MLKRLHLVAAGTSLLAPGVFASPMQSYKQAVLRDTYPVTTSPIPVPGGSNVTYGPTPRADQLLKVLSLDITPSPVPVDRYFFIFLRGMLPRALPNGTKDLDFSRAVLRITSYMVLPDDRRHDSQIIDLPLRTAAFKDNAHISIRNVRGEFAEHLTAGGQNDILTDMRIPGLFVRTGTYGFEVEANLEDGACIFSYTLIQHLDGGLR